MSVAMEADSARSFSKPAGSRRFRVRELGRIVLPNDGKIFVKMYQIFAYYICK